ncbi:MAG TPA: Wzz/FepE/Etk N-terminal domain-containing protein [Ktedonobacterales bacterium]|jgi:Mrp family chromosome partitioning ATPase
MSAREYRDLLLQRWWVVGLSILLVGLGAVAITLFRSPMYQARALVQVDIPSTDTSVIVGVTRVVYTQAQLATSDAVLGDAAARTPGLTVAQLRSSVSATPLANENIIQVTARASLPSTAVTMANDVALSLIGVQVTAMRNNNATALQPLQDAIRSTSNAIEVTSLQLSALTADKGTDPTQVATLQVRLGTLQSQLSQQQTALSEAQAEQAKHAYYTHLAQFAQSDVSQVRATTAINMAAGVGFGLLLGLFAVLAQGIISQRIRSADEVEQLIGAPVLSEAPHEALTQGALQAALRGHIPPHPGFQRLTTALTFLAVERPLRVVAVTRAQDSADVSKSGIAAGLAISKVAEGKYTLLLDTNLTSPSQHLLFGVSDTPGVSDAILFYHAPDAPVAEFQRYCLPPTYADLPMLRIVPAGAKAPNPSGLLKSQAMVAMYNAAATTAVQSIVIDAPSLAGSKGAPAVSALADGAILVVDQATTRRYHLVRARQRIADAGVQLLGCVFVNERSQPVSGTNQVDKEVVKIPAPSARPPTPQSDRRQNVPAYPLDRS